MNSDTTPKLSVVIPTYNRCELLDRLLSQLAAQTVAANEFEIIVADDGSADATKDVVESFGDLLRIKYHFQEDLGFRAALARNTGARMAEAPVLVFVDAGEFVGPDFVAGHLAAHADERHYAVIGYVYGYNPATGVPMSGLHELMDEQPPADIVRAYGDDPTFQDVRQEMLEAIGFDLGSLAMPWQFFWAGNCSVRTADFWAVGGFDENFHGWGLEDLELAYRLFRRGMSFTFTPDAWTIEYPHERDIDDNVAKVGANITQFLAKHPDPVVEICWVLLTSQLLLDGWEESCEQVFAVSRATRDLSVVDELTRVASEIPEGSRVAIIGAGAQVPDSLPTASLIDFDRELLDRALSGTRHTGHHAIGLRTPLADQSVDTVVITSRLAGLWSLWGEELLAEARRIGSDVRVLFAPASSGEGI